MPRSPWVLLGGALLLGLTLGVVAATVVAVRAVARLTDDDLNA